MQRILIIKLGALGDVVMATPLIAAILAHHRDATVTLLTTPAYAPLFADWPGLAVRTTPRRGLRTMLRLVAHLRRMRYARIYDLQGNDRSGVLCALSGARERVGNHCRFPYNLHPSTPWQGQCHIFERLRTVLAAADIAVTATRPYLPAGTATRTQVRAWLDAHDLTSADFVLLHAGASAHRPTKRWPHFAALAERLRTRGLRIVWLGGPPERALNAQLAAADDCDATAAFDILALAELGRHARFAVTNDSGPMHVLSAAGIPVFGLFGPSDWRRNHALGQAARVIACVEVDPRYTGQRSADCLGAVSVEHVWSRLAAERLV